MSTRRIGLLVPHHELPGEVEDLAAAARESVALWQVLTAATDDHSLDALRAAGDERALAPAVERMRRWRPDAIAWACTSGSFVRGRAGALAQVVAIEATAGGTPATSTSLAFVEALAALGIDAVSVVAPYPEPAAEAFRSFLDEWGIAVRALEPLGCAGPSSSELLRPRDVERAVATVGERAPILLPDTAVWGIEIRRALAPRLAVPLLAANQVTLWHAFQLAGLATELDDFGELAGRGAPGTTRREPVGGR